MSGRVIFSAPAGRAAHTPFEGLTGPPAVFKNRSVRAVELDFNSTRGPTEEPHPKGESFHIKRMKKNKNPFVQPNSALWRVSVEVVGFGYSAGGCSDSKRLLGQGVVFTPAAPPRGR